ncbi:MAG: thiol-disulfide oxidoreductase DCC family protein [Bacteroidia bacterium]
MEKIIIFDGVCNLCNSSVDFVIRRDKAGIFKFTANQHEKGKAILAENAVPSDAVNTIYFYEDGKLYHRSTAALRIARHLPFAWNLLYGFIIVPTFVRDAVYNFIAKNRYRWFGEKSTCRLPTKEERARFL